MKHMWYENRKGTIGVDSKRGPEREERGGERDKNKQSMYENAQMKPIALNLNFKKLIKC